MDEFTFIDRVKRKASRGPRVFLGIGDDAAIMDVSIGTQLVVATDAVVENVDFRLTELSPEKIGHKALAVNLSDLAAMGARPVAFVITIGKPQGLSPGWLLRFYDGLLRTARAYGVACAGGDVSRSKEFFANVTILGEVKKGRAVTRSGAAVGDFIGVTGKLGGSIRKHHFDFPPRLREGIFLARGRFATAMIDISDGLIQDLSHILKASKVGAAVDLARVPVSRDAQELSAGQLRKARLRALSDGEDFELLFTVRPRRKKELDKIWRSKFPGLPLTWIGRIERGDSKIRWKREGKNVRGPGKAKKGYIHF
ncbi:MAG: thiamine-phosphate kinase [Candidatus Omnitrophica bacterium]|nr:thiamine-phosphate kinase [Candidatus Omnitrophota bacterium]